MNSCTTYRDSSSSIKMTTSWGGMPFMTPSPTCYKYSHESTVVVPERSIRIGARYRARKNLVENVSPLALSKK